MLTCCAGASWLRHAGVSASHLEEASLPASPPLSSRSGRQTAARQLMLMLLAAAAAELTVGVHMAPVSSGGGVLLPAAEAAAPSPPPPCSWIVAAQLPSIPLPLSLQPPGSSWHRRSTAASGSDCSAAGSSAGVRALRLTAGLSSRDGDAQALAAADVGGDDAPHSDALGEPSAVAASCCVLLQRRIERPGVCCSQGKSRGLPGCVKSCCCGCCCCCCW